MNDYCKAADMKQLLELLDKQILEYYLPNTVS